MKVVCFSGLLVSAIWSAGLGVFCPACAEAAGFSLTGKAPEEISGRLVAECTVGLGYNGTRTIYAVLRVPMKISGDGLTPSLKLFSLNGDGTESFLAATTLRTSNPEETALFIITDHVNEHIASTSLTFRVRQTEGPCAQVEQNRTRTPQLSVTEEESFRFHLPDQLIPVWETDRIVNETVLPVSVNGGAAEGMLLFPPSEGTIIVKNYALDEVYSEGEDFRIDGQRLILLPGTRIPFLTELDLYPETTNAAPGLVNRPSRFGGYVASGEQYWNGFNLAVSYEKNETWSGPFPVQSATVLPLTKSRLRDGLPLKIVLLGDSISVGASASGRSGYPPCMPIWIDLVRKQIESLSSSPITLINPSLGGTTAAWGRSIAPYFAAPEKPDLCIIAFGMNDGGGRPVSSYIEDITAMMDAVRCENPQVEFILVASMLPNERWRSLEPMSGYLPALKELESESISVADVWSVHEHILKTKRYCDVSGNHLNHPNDFMVRVYAQVVSTILGEIID